MGEHGIMAIFTTEEMMGTEVKPKLVDTLTDISFQTEGLLPGQTPLRITNPTMRKWTTIQGVPIDKSAVIPPDRQNFFFVRPEQVKDVIHNQWKAYFKNPAKYGLSEESTLTDVIKKFDQTNPANKLNLLQKMGINVNDTIKTIRENFDLSAINPFSVNEAEASTGKIFTTEEMTGEPPAGKTVFTTEEMSGGEKIVNPEVYTTEQMMSDEPVHETFTPEQPSFIKQFGVELKKSADSALKKLGEFSGNREAPKGFLKEESPSLFKGEGDGSPKPKGMLAEESLGFSNRPSSTAPKGFLGEEPSLFFREKYINNSALGVQFKNKADSALKKLGEISDEDMRNDIADWHKRNPEQWTKLYGNTTEEELYAQGKKEVAGLKAAARGTLSGVSFDILSDEQSAKEFPLAYNAGRVGGGLASFIATGGALKALGLGVQAERAGQAALAISKLGPRFIPRIIMTGSTFGTHRAIQEIVNQSKSGKVDLVDMGKKVATDTALGGALGAAGGVANVPGSVLTASGLGFTSAKLDGAGNPEAVLNGTVWGLFELVGGMGGREINLKKEVLFKHTKTSLADYAQAKDPAMSRAEAEGAADSFLKTEANKAGGVDKVLSSQENSLTFLEKLNQNIFKKSKTVTPEAKPEKLSFEEEVTPPEPIKLKIQTEQGAKEVPIEQVEAPKELFRGGPESAMPKGMTAADVLKYEQEELGNKDVVAEPGVDLTNIKSENLVWLTETKEQAKEYGNVSKSELKNYRVVARDSEGGVLVEKTAGEVIPGEKEKGQEEGVLKAPRKEAPQTAEELAKEFIRPGVKSIITNEKVVDENGKEIKEIPEKKERKAPVYDVKKALDRLDYRTLILSGKVAFPESLRGNFAPEEIKNVKMLFQGDQPFDVFVKELKANHPYLGIEDDADMIRKAIKQVGKKLESIEKSDDEYAAEQAEYLRKNPTAADQMKAADEEANRQIAQEDWDEELESGDVEAVNSDLKKEEVAGDDEKTDIGKTEVAEVKKDRGRPEPGKQYALTGGKGQPSIMGGNTWAESEVREISPEDKARKERIGKLVPLMKDLLESGNEILSNPVELRKMVKEEIGGEPKEYYDDIYDALELALNEYSRKDLATGIHNEISDKLSAAKSLEEKLPLRQRSLETIKMQQFSTPLTLATAANYALNPQIGDTILEPTAGTGNLIIPFWNGRWNLIANELDKRRLAVLEIAKIEMKITDQDFLKYSGPNPSAIISNPPFGALSTGKYANFAADFTATNMDQRFIAKMLRLLPDGGRIAVIVSEGTGSGSSGFPFRKWLQKEHTLIASLASPEGAYKYRGSPTIGTSLMIIEKGKLRGNVKPIITEPALRLVEQQLYAKEGQETVVGGTTWEQYAAHLASIRKQFPRIDISTKSDTLKSGGQTNVSIPTATSTVGQPAGRPAEVSPQGSERGGSSEPVAGPEQRPTVVPTEPPASRTGVEDDVGQGTPRVGSEVRQEGTVDRPSNRKVIGSFVEYKRNNTLPVSNPHPSVIVESRELASVDSPKITYRPGKRLNDSYKEKNLSDPQMDTALLALQSISKGKGFLIADDVGVGKTREMAAIALDALDSGKANRVLYVTISKEVLDNHLTGDFSTVMTGKEKNALPFETVRLEGFTNLSKQENLPVRNKALYTITRDLLKRAPDRVMQLGFDLIIFDEAHQWRPNDENQAKAIAWKKIHSAMDGKPIIYATATPGVDLGDLHYLYGLGEWKAETFDAYLQNLTGEEPSRGGMFSGSSSFTFGASIPLTQQFMRELKMKGLYSSRDLSRQNVKFSSEKVDYTEKDIAAYDKYMAFLNKAYKVGIKYSKFNKVSGARGVGLIKAMMQNAAKRFQLDEKLTRIMDNVKKDIAEGKRVFLFTSGLNELDPEAPKGYVRAVINAINEDSVESVEGEILSDKIPEAIEEKALLLDQLSELPPQLSVEKYVRETLGTKYKIGFYTGNTSGSQRIKYLRDWNAGKIDIMLGSDAAKTAISAHDTIGREIRNYYLDIDFEVVKFKQALGRTNRSGEKTSPSITIPHLGAAGEQKFISTVAVRMKNLGATSKGQAESGVVDFLSEFDLEGSIANQAARNVFTRISDQDKSLFINEKLWETGPDKVRRPRRTAPNGYMVDNFLFDLNFMSYADGNDMFSALIKEYKDIVSTSSLLSELRAERLAGKEIKKMVLYQNPSDPTDSITLHDVVDKSGQHFGIVTGRLLDKTKIFAQHGVRHFVKFSTEDDIITGKKVLPSYIQPLSKAFGKDVASSITKENAYDVIMSGDKIPLVKSLEVYKRKDGLFGIKNAKMADRITLEKAGAGFSSAGMFWFIKNATRSGVSNFLEYYPISQTNVDSVEAEIGKSSIDPNITHLGAGPAPTAFLSQRRAVNDTIAGITFSNPETEARYQAANGIGNTSNSLIGKIKNFFSSFLARATRTYPALPNDPEYSVLRNILNRQKFARSVSQDRTIRAIEAITAGFGPKKLDLLTRKIILDDLMAEADLGHPLPFGYSHYEEGIIFTDKTMLEEDLARVDQLIEQNPDVKEAVAKRKRLWSAITSELVNFGVLKQEQLKENYFRHQVIEYARTKATFSTGSRLKTPKPGYAKKRSGSVSDINTNYVEAEFEVMSQAFHDIETAKNIKEIEEGPLNIKQMLVDEAAELTESTGNKTTWKDIIPEGYTTWQPAEGNVFYSATSLPQRIVQVVIDNAGEGSEITADDLRRVLAIGGKKKQFVVKQEVADTLSELYKMKDPNWITAAARTLTTKWKQWVLMNPRRAFKYNLQNFFGDFDAVLAGEPKILAKFARAFGELVDVMYKGKPMPTEMREFFERGGLTAQMTVNELPELRRLEVFSRLLGQGEQTKLKLNLWRRYWSAIGTFTTFRESIFRYAAYLHYREVLSSGGKPGYGASIKSEIDALPSGEDKAAKLATELLGDYANLTALGQDMREAVIPFYSWLEINFKRYNRLTRNAFEDSFGKGVGTVGTVAAAKGSRFLLKFMMQATAMTGALMLYNHIFWPDEEDDLSEYDRNRLHIILGRDKNGRVRLLRTQGALGDMLEWFGLDAAPSLWRDYFDGKTSFADIFGRIPGTDFPAFGLNPFNGKIGLHPMVTKILRGVNPLYKLPFETLTGRSLPVFDDKSWRVEDKIRNVLKALSLENEYDFAMRKPSRGWIRSLEEAFVAVQDPEENAFRYIQGQKYQFLETVKGKGGSSDYYSPRSLLYREYKKALRFNDMRALALADKKMRAAGITHKELMQSKERTDPLSGLSARDKAEFLNHYLSDRDRKVYFPKAQKYYRDTFLRR